MTANPANFKTLTTIKADSKIVSKIREIADSEGRKIQVVTNRLLKFALDEYNRHTDSNANRQSK